MTDDLVKRLREYAIHMDAWGKEANHDADIVDEAADRIEQLNRSSEGWKEIADEYFDAIGERNTRIEKLEEQAHYANGVADLAMKHRDYAEQRVETLEAALRKIMNLGQSAVPDHWEARCLARDTARKALEGKND